MSTSIDLARVEQTAGLMRMLTDHERAMVIQQVLPARTKPLRRGRVQLTVVLPAVDLSTTTATTAPQDPIRARRRRAERNRWGFDDPGSPPPSAGKDA